MPKKKTFRFIVNTEWSMKTDRAQVFSRVYNHYGKRDFQDRCFNTLHAVFKPLSLALEGGSPSEVQREIRATRDKVEMLLELASELALPTPEWIDEPAVLSPQPTESLPAADLHQETIETVYSQQENDPPSLMEIFNSD